MYGMAKAVVGYDDPRAPTDRPSASVPTGLDRLDKELAVLGESLVGLFDRMAIATRPEASSPNVDAPGTSEPSSELLERLRSMSARVNSFARRVQTQTELLDLP